MPESRLGSEVYHRWGLPKVEVWETVKLNIEPSRLGKYQRKHKVWHKTVIWTVTVLDQYWVVALCLIVLSQLLWTKRSYVIVNQFWLLFPHLKLFYQLLYYLVALLKLHLLQVDNCQTKTYVLLIDFELLAYLKPSYRLKIHLFLL